MKKDKQIAFTKEFVQKQLENDASGHDWWHIVRVAKTAKTIAEQEQADLFICEMSALLHDIADEKLNPSEEEGFKKVKDWLNTIEVDDKSVSEIIRIISTMSYKGGGQPAMQTLEGKIVQDADRLDAIGAIGIARTFAYAGSKGDMMYDPAIVPREQMTKEEYRTGKSTAVNHFYEKLLKLKELMNTDYAKLMAEDRHRFMEVYLQMFFKEWEGK
ncbi:MAG: HD domain-containing protein [Bacillus sp. (in: firmicutes)]